MGKIIEKSRDSNKKVKVAIIEQNPNKLKIEYKAHHLSSNENVKDTEDRIDFLLKRIEGKGGKEWQGSRGMIE